MIFGLYAIRDLLNGYLPPMADSNDDTARRNFTIAMTANAADDFGVSPKDFDLYRIGSYDTDTGLITSDTNPVRLLSGLDAIRARYIPHTAQELVDQLTGEIIPAAAPFVSPSLDRDFGAGCDPDCDNCALREVSCKPNFIDGCTCSNYKESY